MCILIRNIKYLVNMVEGSPAEMRGIAQSSTGGAAGIPWLEDDTTAET